MDAAPGGRIITSNWLEPLTLQAPYREVEENPVATSWFPFTQLYSLDLEN